MIFNTITKVSIKKNEVVGVRLHEGKSIIGVVDSIEKDHFWLRISPDPNSQRERFSFKIDQIIKLN
jgi:uncharacterized Fe-S cluster-containing protein